MCCTSGELPTLAIFLKTLYNFFIRAAEDDAEMEDA